MENTWKEVSAKTVEEAVTEAIAELMTTSDKLEYEIIEEGKSGFLGIGAKPARIRARIKAVPAVESVKEEIPVEAERTNRGIVEEAAVSFENDEDKEGKRDGRTLSVDEIRSLADTFLKDVFEAMGLAVTESSEYDENEGELVVHVDTEDKGILIGKRGQTLDSLQYLTSLVVNKDSDKYIKVKVDSEDYRARRKETLENLARNISSKVKRTGHSVSLEPMNSFERRIIHSALQLDDEVETHSEGSEPYRKVVVSLTREAYAKRKTNHSTNDHGRKPYGHKPSYGSHSGGYSHGGYGKSSYSSRKAGDSHPKRNDYHHSNSRPEAEQAASGNTEN